MMWQRQGVLDTVGEIDVIKEKEIMTLEQMTKHM